MGMTQLLALIAPIVLGILVARGPLKRAHRSALEGLNVYALYVGFPALIMVGLMRASVSLPEQWAFYALWPVALLIMMLIVVWLIPKAIKGTVALVICFGNVAYLGLPLVGAVVDLQLAGALSLLVSLHVVLAVSLGVLMLERFSPDGARSWRTLLRGVARQPLLWAPPLGLLGRMLNKDALNVVLGVLGPIGQSAASVALFLLGAYLYKMRGALWPISSAVWWHVGARLIGAPLLVLALGGLATRLGLLPFELLRVQVLLACMPAAVTTFSMAYEKGQGQEVVASAVVWSTLLAPVAFGLWYLGLR